MAAGSVGGFDLYKVVETYMLDLEKRHEINELLHIAEDASFIRNNICLFPVCRENVGNRLI